MSIEDIKKTLARHSLHIWQLCNQLGISRQTYYKYSHRGFKGYENQIKQAIHELINNQKEDKDNAD